MIIILYHAADRNFQAQFPQNLQSNVYLSTTAIHHQEIRKTGKAAKGRIHSFFLQSPCLLQAMTEPPGQYLPHGSIIIWSFHCLDLEFTVITAFWLSIFVHDHGTNRLHTAGIRNIVSLYPAYPF